MTYTVSSVTHVRMYMCIYTIPLEWTKSYKRAFNVRTLRVRIGLHVLVNTIDIRLRVCKR